VIAQQRTGSSNVRREECTGSCERRGMELDKFHIRHYSAGASCSQQTLPGDRRRRRRRRKQPSITARCQYHGRGVELLLPRRRSVEHSTETSIGDRQTGYRWLIDDLHTTVVCELLNAVGQKRRQRRTCTIFTGVAHASTAVVCLQAKGRVALC